LEALLERWRNGDNAASEQIFTAAYGELRRIAAIHFRREQQGHTLQPTALVNEVFLKLSLGKPVQWKDRAHFYAVFSRHIRLFLVDHARRRRASKRNDTRIPAPFSSEGKRSNPHLEEVLTIDKVLREFEALDCRAAQVAELRVFGGLNYEEIGDSLQISVSTVKKDWNIARAWLVKRLGEN